MTLITILGLITFGGAVIIGAAFGCTVFRDEQPGVEHEPEPVVQRRRIEVPPEVQRGLIGHLAGLRAAGIEVGPMEQSLVESAYMSGVCFGAELQAQVHATEIT